MARPLNIIAARDSHIWTLRMAILGLLTLLMLLLLGWWNTRSEITVHIPPDLSSGATLPAGQVPAPNVYAFALTMFQSLNFWPESGEHDYPRMAKAHQCYHTPAFRRWVKQNIRDKRLRGELHRTRGMQPRSQYTEKSVHRIAPDTWSVQLELELREWVQNRKVKDTAVRYALRVTAFDISRQCNPWGLALDGHEHPPKRMESS